MTLFYDTLFRQKRKGDKWKIVDAPQPALEGPVADTHCHLHMAPEPAFALARCALNGVPFVCCITDPSEDGLVVFEQLEQWRRDAAGHIDRLVAGKAFDQNGEAVGQLAEAPDLKGEGLGQRATTVEVPATAITVGVHPHNAKLFDDKAEAQLRELLQDPRVCALGEIGLDYHYDLSPREDQRRAFRRQIQIAHELGLPVSLHLREAHEEAFDILQEEGWPQAGTLLHCCTVGPDQIDPWINAGCYIAFGGAMTFNNGEAIRQAMLKVPLDRLLTETDTPYMAPVPLRGSDCQPDFVLFTAQRLAQLRGCDPGLARQQLLAQLYQNAMNLLMKD